MLKMVRHYFETLCFLCQQTEVRVDFFILPNKMLIILTGAGLGLLLLIIITIILFKVRVYTQPEVCYLYIKLSESPWLHWDHQIAVWSNDSLCVCHKLGCFKRKKFGEDDLEDDTVVIPIPASTVGTDKQAEKSSNDNQTQEKSPLISSAPDDEQIKQSGTDDKSDQPSEENKVHDDGAAEEKKDEATVTINA